MLAGEPVLVLVEQVLHNQTHNTIGLVEPWVLNTTAEVEWNLGQFAQNPLTFPHESYQPLCE